jgi:hypothetical protein
MGEVGVLFPFPCSDDVLLLTDATESEEARRERACLLDCGEGRPGDRPSGRVALRTGFAPSPAASKAARSSLIPDLLTLPTPPGTSCVSQDQ